MTNDEASEAYVKIGIRDIYAEQRVHGDKLTKIETTLEGVGAALIELTKLTNNQDMLRRELDIMKAEGAGSEHELRLRKLEKWKAALPISLIMAMISLAAVVVAAVHR